MQRFRSDTNFYGNTYTFFSLRNESINWTDGNRRGDTVFLFGDGPITFTRELIILPWNYEAGSNSISLDKIFYTREITTRDSPYVLCANICTAHWQRRRGLTVPQLDTSTSSNNFSKHKSSVKPEASWSGYPRIIAKRYCLASIDLVYKMLGYPYRLCAVRSEGGSMSVWDESRISLNHFDRRSSRI